MLGTTCFELSDLSSLIQSQFKDYLSHSKNQKLCLLLHDTPSYSCLGISCLMLLNLYQQQLFLQCYSFYWCQELCGKLLSIQSKRPTVFFAKSNTSTFLVVLNALLQFYVKYNCIEETSRCFYHKLSHWKLFKHSEVFFQNLSQEKERSIDENMSFRFGKEEVECPEKLQMTNPVSFSIAWCHVLHYLYQL